MYNLFKHNLHTYTQNTMTNIYILQLINNKYYIGKTNNTQKRMLNHFQQQGSAWTKKYKPIRIEKIINNADDFDEDKWTIKYMKLYGIDNVRGGSFCSIQLSESNKQTLQQMITGSGDCCYKCGQPEHFIQNCPFLEQGKEYTENCCSGLDLIADIEAALENRQYAKHPAPHSSSRRRRTTSPNTVKYITNKKTCSQCGQFFPKKVIFSDPNVRAAKHKKRREFYERRQRSQMAVRRVRGSP
jgi:hypothetical protein